MADKKKRPATKQAREDGFVRVPKRVLRRLKIRAADTGKPMRDIAGGILELYLDGRLVEKQ